MITSATPSGKSDIEYIKNVSKMIAGFIDNEPDAATTDNSNTAQDTKSCLSREFKNNW